MIPSLRNTVAFNLKQYMVNYLNIIGRGRSEGGKEGEKSGGGEVNWRIGRMGGKRGRYFFFFLSPTPPNPRNHEYAHLYRGTHTHILCLFVHKYVRVSFSYF